MDKFFNSMEFIDIEMACQWLCHLTESPFTPSSRALMELCEHYSTPVYIDCSALEGVIAPRAGNKFVVQRVTGLGHCQVDSPVSAYEAFAPQRNEGIEVTGMAVVISNEEEPKHLHAYSWILTNQGNRPFLFRPSEIKRLASFLKPDQGEKTDEIQVPPETIVTSNSSKIENRLEFIRRWFEEQEEYEASQLSSQGNGLPGARDALK